MNTATGPDEWDGVTVFENMERNFNHAKHTLRLLLFPGDLGIPGQATPPPSASHLMDW